MSTAAISIMAAGGDQLDRIGAIAGLASVIGLGVMSLLYFAQAREVKRLREWAGRAPERAAELEQRVQTDAQRRVTAQPLAPATTAAQQQAEAAREAAAAALYAKLPPPPPPPAPLVPQAGQLARPGVPVATAAPPATPGAVNTPAPGSVQPVTATPAATSVPKPTPTPTPSPAPSSAAAVSTTGSATPTPTPSPTTTRAAAAKAPPAKATAYPTAATAAAAAAAARATPPSTTLGNGAGEQHTQASAAARPSPPPLPPSRPPERDHDDDGFGAGRLVAIIGGAVVVLVAAVGLMLMLTGEEPKPPPNGIGSAGTAPAPGATEDPGASADEEPSGAASSNAVDRPATNIAVLNGTTQTGLARGVADKLEKAKFTIKTVGNNADQRVPRTIVSYTEGNERAANLVAEVIDVDRSVVQPSDRNATVSAEADVVVTVGTDQIE